MATKNVRGKSHPQQRKKSSKETKGKKLARLLLLLAELFRELLDLLAFSSALACVVMHRTSRATIIAVGLLMGALVIAQEPASTSCCSCSGGCPGQRLVVAVGLLLLIVLAIVVVVVATLSSRSRIRLAYLPCFWGRWRMPVMAFYGPGSLVS
jgi:hypothetical protein